MEDTPNSQPADEEQAGVPHSEDEGELRADLSPTESPDTTEQPPAESTAPEPQATPESMAVDDLASRLGLTADVVTVVLTEDVIWPDGSLGCPEPGMAYTQALVDGFRIVLEAGGEEYHYHAAIGSEPFYCPNPSQPATDRPGDA